MHFMKLGMFMLWTDSVWAPFSPGSVPSTSEVPVTALPSSDTSASLRPTAKSSSRRARPNIEDEATAS